MKGTTGEFIVSDGRAVHRTRTVARRPYEERWHADNLKLVVGVPWRKSDDDPNTDGEKMERREFTPEEKQAYEEQARWKEQASGSAT